MPAKAGIQKPYVPLQTALENGEGKKSKVQETRKDRAFRVSCGYAYGKALPVGTPPMLPRLLRQDYFSACTAATTSLVSGTVGISYCFTKRTTPSLSITTTARAVMPRSPR